MTETGHRIVLPNTRAYDAAGTGDHSLFSREHCCICGRPAKGDNWLLLARAPDGTREFAISSTVGLSDEERRSVWIAPIGPDCLRQHPELRFALLVTVSDAEQLMKLRKAAQEAYDWILVEAEIWVCQEKAQAIATHLDAALNPSHLQKETQ